MTAGTATLTQTRKCRVCGIRCVGCARQGIRHDTRPLEELLVRSDYPYPRRHKCGSCGAVHGGLLRKAAHYLEKDHRCS